MANLAYTTGVKELDRALKEFHPQLQKQIGRKTLREVARPVHKELVAYALFDEGEYRKTIKIQAAKRSRAKDKRHVIGIQIGTSKRALEKWAERERAEREQPNWFFNPHWREYGTKFQQGEPHFRMIIDKWAFRVPVEFARLLPSVLEGVVKKVRADG